MVKTSIRYILVWFELFKVDKPNIRNLNNFGRISDIVWNPNNLGMKLLCKRSVFGRLQYYIILYDA